jgi:dihydrodipicolinate synthase/N-acetylneuraminate lyase
VSLTIRGVLGPVVTPFDATGEIDLSAFTLNIRGHLEAGLNGIVVTGSTGEAALLDERERAALVEAARAVIPGDRALIVGTGAESTRMAQRLTRLAADRGADAALVVAPHYYGAKAMTSAALRAHYTAIADTSSIPVLLYNIPKYMHFALPPQLVAELARHENIVGMKDSSGDLELLAGYLQAQSDSFTVLTGNGSTFQRALALGARGGILAVALFAPALALDIYKAMREASASSIANAEEAQRRLEPPSGRIVGQMGVPGVKAALDHIGLHGGAVRSPLQPLGAAEISEVAQLLRAAEQSLAA